jgi:catechol 2,3-dioxygenase-like lactoylglutathione lyase family enzyme
MPMFTHVAVGTNDLAKVRAFYDAALAPLGCKRLKDLGDRGSCWGETTEEFNVLTPADGNPRRPPMAAR